MQAIKAILFEPVGCLAEFPAEPFQEIAARLFHRRRQPSKSGSRAYWHLLNLIESSGKLPDLAERQMAEALEVEAAAGASVYSDVLPALSELRTMGVQLLVASSLSYAAVARLMAPNLFSAIHTRNNAGGVKAAPLRSAIAAASLEPRQTIFLTDTAEGMKVAKSVGVHAILMMNDPDEARRLAAHDPAGGIVSLHELPDFIRLVAAENARRVC